MTVTMLLVNTIASAHRFAHGQGRAPAEPDDMAEAQAGPFLADAS